jgi:ketosteroid isomerase-like protein
VVRSLLFALLLLPRLLAAQASASDSAALVKVEHAAEAAIVRGDSAALDSLWAADLLFRHAGGELEQRGDWFATLRAGVPRFQLRQPDSLAVVLHGDVAVVTGWLHVRTLAPADEYRIRYVRVYARRSGRWRLVHHHSLALEEMPS